RGPQRDGIVDAPGGTSTELRGVRRPAQQSFRSLERPVNTAVLAPNGEQLVNQGLAAPLTPRRARQSAEDPFAPNGLRLGTFVVSPTVDLQGGYDSNPERRDSTQRRKGSTFARAEAGLGLRSDWSRHQLSAEIRGGYSRFFATPDANRPDASGRANLRLDATRDTAFDAELRGRLDTQTPGGANLTGTAVGRPFVYQTGASAGVTQRYNRLALSARASVDRSDFEDAKLSGGQTLSQRERNFTQYGLRLRSGYEVTPGIIPFAEALIDTRRYDEKRDGAGFQRDSTGLQLRLGSSFELTRTLTGEIIGGYGLRRFEDQRLRDLRGPVVEAGLSWFASPLTTLRLRAATEFDETTIAGSSGSINRRIGAEISHAFLRNLALTAGVSFARADFTGIVRRDDTLRMTLALDYNLGRNAVLRASYANERTTSNTPGNNISANVWLFGARMQY
ncbi:MAG: outer membrane beta-barrel protein, partial [Beijerinckiaceae bacterium]